MNELRLLKSWSTRGWPMRRPFGLLLLHWSIQVSARRSVYDIGHGGNRFCFVYSASNP